MNRVGQNHIYTVHIRYFWQGIHQIYGVYIRFWPTLEMKVTRGTMVLRVVKLITTERWGRQ